MSGRGLASSGESMTKFRLSTIALVALAAGGAFTSAASAAVDPTAVSSAVSTAITGATPNGPPAVTVAIKAAVEAELKQFGTPDAKSVVTDLIADAISDGATPQEIGQALGQAALELGAPDSNAIADAVGGAGDSEILSAFDTTVASAAGGAELAAEADAHTGQNQPNGPLTVGAVSAGGGVTGAGAGVSGSACVEASPNQCQ